jgi:hypothetical protein
LAAFKPEAPTTVTTSIDGPKTVIEWSDPIDNGSPITGYKIYIVEHDSVVFTFEGTECDGTSTDVITNRRCEVSLFTLIEEPWALELDESIQVKVIS